MLPKHLRLPYRESTAIKRTGKRFEIEVFRLYFSPGKESRFLVTVPKKYIRLSTARHRLKRLLHEVLRTRIVSQLKIQGAFVIQVKKPVELKNVDEAKMLLDQLFIKLFK